MEHVAPIGEVQLAPGSGRACRRPSTVLFVPTPGGDEVIKSFLSAATDRAAIRAALEYVVATNFSVAPFVIIDWSDGLRRLLVFGDLDVTTSSAAAPLISGSTSKTWVEHTLLESSGVQVLVGDGPIDPLTSLDAGVAHAGAVSVRFGTSHDQPLSSEPLPIPDRLTAVAQASPPPIASVAAAYRLRLSDGSIIDLSTPVLIGRKPSAETIDAADAMNDLRPVALDDEKLSRNHLIATSTPDGVEILDCGSLNGTRTGFTADSVVTIATGVADVAAPGSIIEFGEQRAIVESGSEPL